MKKLLFTFLLSLSFVLVLGMGRVEAAKSHTLYAGQSIEVGEVIVDNDMGNIYIIYKVDAPWCLVETHVHIGKGKSDFPLVGKMQNPVPGQFNFREEHDCLTEYTYEIPIEEGWTSVEELLIAAHASLEKMECSLLQQAPYSGYRVTSYDQGVRYDNTAVRMERSNPDAILSFGLTKSETNFFSLGFQSEGEEDAWIIVEFDKPITNGVGDDIRVVEDTWGLPYPNETAGVWVSNDLNIWTYLGEANNQSPLSDGIHTVSNFNLPDEMEYARYVKVQDTSVRSDFNEKYTAQAATLDGFDLNVIQALHDYIECDVTDSQTAWAGVDRFNQKGNWATYFKYELQCNIYVLDITSVNGSAAYTHWFEIKFCPLYQVSGVGGRPLDSATRNETISEIKLDGNLLSFKSQYMGSSYIWYPSFILEYGEPLQFVDGYGPDNVWDADGVWDMARESI